MKKIGAILIVIAVILGWIFSATGLGWAPLNERLSLGLDMIGGVSVVLEAETDATGKELKEVMDQVQAVMEKRVNEMGLSEPVIAIENENRIRIELPGASNAQEAIESIGKTAQLSFMTADGNVFLNGEHVKKAIADKYQGSEPRLMGTYVVIMEFDSYASDAFGDATRKIMNGEIVSTTEYDANQIAIFLDDQCISDPYVNSVINSANCEITGNYTASTAGNLAALIRGGSLPVGLKEIQTEIVGPTLGIDAAKKSVVAGAIGIALVFILMVAFYRLPGLVADISLALYVLIVLWTLVGLKAVLTLPGIAGIILSVGMAVDSNVIIFSRIREEIAVGKTIRVAVKSGFKSAMATIIDSQVTTIIAALILYIFGSGTVRGFAMTLLIGIIVSLLTAVLVSNLLLEVIADNKKLANVKFFGSKAALDDDSKGIQFMSLRKKFYIVSASVIVIGLVMGFVRGFNLGIDFTGGTMLQLNMGKEVAQTEVDKVLDKYGVDADIQYAGQNNEKLIIKTTSVIDNDARENLYEDLRQTFSVQNSDTFIEQAGLIGPSVGSQLKSGALKSMLLAGIAMLIYVAVRFEWRFGVASILALLHDTLVLFAFYGIFHVQMNSPFIAGLLIVIGYSINDTIVIFDRIRENLKGPLKLRQERLINLSVNQCIGRSIMTSVTTMAAIIPLIIICGDAIRTFAIPLLVGVTAGTFSSICIAPAIYYEICRLTKKNRYRGA